MKSKNPPWICYNCNKPGHITCNCLEPHAHQVHNADVLSPETIQVIVEAIKVTVRGNAVGGILVCCKTHLQVPDSRVQVWSQQSCLRRDKIQYFFGKYSKTRR